MDAQTDARFQLDLLFERPVPDHAAIDRVIVLEPRCDCEDAGRRSLPGPALLQLPLEQDAVPVPPYGGVRTTPFAGTGQGCRLVFSGYGIGWSDARLARRDCKRKKKKTLAQAKIERKSEGVYLLYFEMTGDRG